MDVENDALDISDSDSEENKNLESTFNRLSSEEKEERIRWLWYIVYMKSKGSGAILKTFGMLNHRILDFGTKRGIIQSK